MAGLRFPSKQGVLPLKFPPLSALDLCQPRQYVSPLFSPKKGRKSAGLPHGVMVAQLILVQLVKVRILVG